MTDFKGLLSVLIEGEVDFILIGGVAAIVHGSARFTQDLDVVYGRSPENIERLSVAVDSIKPYLRGAPPGLPFRFDARTIARGLNFTLTTHAGDLDLLGEIPGGDYLALQPFAEQLSIYGLNCPVLGLEKLIEDPARRVGPKILKPSPNSKFCWKKRNTNESRFARTAGNRQPNRRFHARSFAFG